MCRILAGRQLRHCGCRWWHEQQALPGSRTFPPSLLDTHPPDITLTRVTLYPLPRRYKIIFYTPSLSFAHFSGEWGESSSIPENFGKNSFSRRGVEIFLLPGNCCTFETSVCCGRAWAWPISFNFRTNLYSAFIPRFIGHQRTRLVKLVTKRNLQSPIPLGVSVRNFITRRWNLSITRFYYIR